MARIVACLLLLAALSAAAMTWFVYEGRLQLRIDVEPSCDQGAARDQKRVEIERGDTV
ncbi:hypothetical protein [Paraburkholderia nodosa]|uniref:hypothetical protein n=1 Tax=Paraburkholderia nodosa TaxID=392320 RepID=UPI0012B6935A|nr:hypothetical protein [Paraburkholderia nodosa]